MNFAGTYTPNDVLHTAEISVREYVFYVHLRLKVTYQKKT